MSAFRKFKKKATSTVIAVQLNLDTPGFEYEKWGGKQKCKAGDWLVDNNGDVYTINKKTFEQTYREVSAGVYYKPVEVWAVPAEQDGKIQTKEGETSYVVGNVIVYNNEDLTDGYAMSKSTFDGMYEPV
jgi:hypothetical protein